MNSGNKVNLLEISVKNNYWKPYQFLFRYFQLIEYEKLKLSLEKPVIELGIGDGIFTNMLVESQVLSNNLIALDYNLESLKKAKSFNFKDYLRADILSLPIKNNSISTICSNGVLCSLKSKSDHDLIKVFREARRVLKKNGIFIVSVATNMFNENLSTFRF